jgi:hypothetical protein
MIQEKKAYRNKRTHIYIHIHTKQIASHYQKFAARSAMTQEEKAKSSLLDQTTPRVQRILKGLEKPDFPGKPGDEKLSDT